MISITRKFEFDSAHRVLGHTGKCRHLHGHRYVAEVTLHSVGLDELGMVVDFSVVKDLIGTWIDANWDHNILLHEKDPLACIWAGSPNKEIFMGRSPYIFYDENPTAENIAKALFHQASKLLANQIPLTVGRVRIWETPNCYADYSF